jgi:molybdopterin/thiamine biosynthesis adenylyltransferase
MKAVTLFLAFQYGDLVYLITDAEQERRMITGYTVRGASITYELSCGTETTWHRAEEITYDKSIALT